MTEVENEVYEEREEIIEKYEEEEASENNKNKKGEEKTIKKSEVKNKGKNETKSSKKKEEDEEEEDEESEEESDEESEDKNKKEKKNKENIKKQNTKDSKKAQEKVSSKDNIQKNIKRKTNIKKNYTEKEIMEMAGFIIEKSSKDKNEGSDEEENNNENEFQKKIEPDPPEIRKIRIQAAKIKNEFPKINEAKGGELAVKCWNCENINICNTNVNVIQCPVCHEMNKVPKPMDRIDELLQLAKANTCITYSDINHTVPLVNYVVVCPYCKCDNKVRETAYFCICYMCKNRWTIRRPDADNVKEIKKQKPPKQKRFEGNYYKYDSKTGNLIPPDKPLRFSDLFYPDPMFYPGYYPINSLSPLYPEYFTPYDDYRYIDRQEKTMKYFDRVNQQKKMMEQFGDILEDNNNIINNKNNVNNINNKRLETPISTRYEKPYYHLNYDEDLNKRDILTQLEALDKKSENLMKNRIFPKAITEKSSEHSTKALKSRYNGLGESIYDGDENYKSGASLNISSVKSDLKAPENNNINNNMSKSNSQFSKNKNPRESGASYTNSNNRSSQNDVSSKIKSIENTYFMNK